MAVSINSSSSIIVSWSPPVGGADGYVILCNKASWLVEGGDQTSSLLTGLSEGQLYTIRVLAYKDLPSLLSDPELVKIDGKEFFQLCLKGSPTLVTTMLPTTPTIGGISVLIPATGAGGGSLVVVIVIVVLVCIVVSVFSRRYMHKCSVC